MKNLTLIPCPVQELIQPKDDIAASLKKNLPAGITLENGDILAISSKVISVSEGRIFQLDDFKPSEEAKIWAEKANLDPRFAQAIVEDSEEILGASPGALLTLKYGILIANAGIDQSNAPEGKMIFWPKDPKESAKNLRKNIGTEWNVNQLGIIITDSHCLPLRMGTVGIAMTTAGFLPLIDERGKTDLYGKTMRITQRDIGDGLAAAANMLMGDTTEKIPFVIIRGYPADFEKDAELRLKKEECLFSEWYPKKS